MRLKGHGGIAKIEVHMKGQVGAQRYFTPLAGHRAERIFRPLKHAAKRNLFWALDPRR